MLKKVLLIMVGIVAVIQTTQASQSASDILNDPDIFFPEYVEEFTQALNNAQFSHDTSYKIAGNIVDDECQIFINKNYFFGNVGKYISATMLKYSYDHTRLFNGGSVNRYCRNYKKLTSLQKSYVWVLVLMTMAQFESSCNYKANAKGPNGTANGLYQLHLGKESEYDGKEDACYNNASKDTLKSTKCTLGMLELQYQRQNMELFSNQSYWDVLRPNGRSQKYKDIQKALLNSSFCNGQGA